MNNWFALYTRSNFERKVVENLSSKNIEAYCPTFKTIKQYSDRKKKVEKVLLPNYVFVKVNSTNRENVFSADGVLRYVYWMGKPAKIRSIEIDQMKSYLNQFYDDFSLDNIKLNTNYKIRSGPMKGLTGIIVEIKKNKIRLKLESLGYLITLKRL